MQFLTEKLRVFFLSFYARTPRDSDLDHTHTHNHLHWVSPNMLYESVGKSKQKLLWRHSCTVPVALPLVPGRGWSAPTRHLSVATPVQKPTTWSYEVVSMFSALRPCEERHLVIVRAAAESAASPATFMLYLRERLIARLMVMRKMMKTKMNVADFSLAFLSFHRNRFFCPSYRR